jgi:hypothetical protein
LLNQLLLLLLLLLLLRRCRDVARVHGPRQQQPDWRVLR